MKYVESRYGIRQEMSRDEQEEQFAKNIHDILTNTRFVLDNLDRFPTYQVNWISYATCKGGSMYKINPLFKKSRLSNGNKKIY